MATPKRLLSFHRVVICVLFIITLSLSVGAYQTFTPQKLTPLQNVQITFAQQQINQGQFESTSTRQFEIQSLSTSIHHTLTTIPPITTTPQFQQQSISLPFDREANHHLYPFGSQLQLTFQLPDELEPTMFTLAVDDDLLGDGNASFQNQHNEKVYTTFTVFKGEHRSDPINHPDDVDIIIVSVTPNTGDYLFGSGDEKNNNLETLSTNNTMTKTTLYPQQQTPQSTPFSPLSQNSYTIEGTILRSNGDTYQIQSFSSLLWLKQQELFDLEQQYDEAIKKSELTTTINQQSFTSQQLQSLSTTIDTLSFDITAIQELQQLSSYDLAMYKLDLSQAQIFQQLEVRVGVDHSKVNSHFASPCGTHTPLNQHKKNDIEISSQQLHHGFTFRRWENCHRYINDLTLFTIKPFISQSYAMFASDSKKVANEAKIISRMKSLLAMVNIPYRQQLGIVWQFKDFQIRLTTTAEVWNISTEHGKNPGCKQTDTSPDYLLDRFSMVRYNASVTNKSEVNTTVNFMFFHCPPFSEGYTAGIAFVGGALQSYTANGWAVIQDPTNSYVTVAHELGHLIGILHPFGTNLKTKGHYGGIMDYDHVRLPDSNPQMEAARFFAFNEVTDYGDACTTLDLFFQYTGLSIMMENGYKVLSLPSPQQLKTTDGNAGVTANDDMISPTCGNGFVEPYEECDGDNTCCNNCKFTPNSTCNGRNSECCDPTTCQDYPANSKRCTINNIPQAGVCYFGDCVPMILTGAISSPEDFQHCSDDVIFIENQFVTGNCGYVVPTPKSCKSDPKVVNIGIFPFGTICQQANGIRGICLPAFEFNSSDFATCVSLVNTSYTWSWQQFQSCQCPTVTQVKGTFSCVNAAGHIVASSFCENVPKPVVPTCDCTKIYEWEYTEPQSDVCHNTLCEVGVRFRSGLCTCEGCESGLTNNNFVMQQLDLESDDLNEQIAGIPMDYVVMMKNDFTGETEPTIVEMPNDMKLKIIRKERQQLLTSPNGLTKSYVPTALCTAALGSGIFLLECPVSKKCADMQTCEWSRSPDLWKFCHNREMAAPDYPVDWRSLLTFFVTLTFIIGLIAVVILGIIYCCKNGLCCCSKRTERTLDKELNKSHPTTSIDALQNDHETQQVYVPSPQSATMHVPNESKQALVMANDGDDQSDVKIFL